MSAATREELDLTRSAARAVEHALQGGAQEADALVESRREFRADVHDRRLETLKQADSRGLGLRVIVERRVALVYTSDIRDQAVRDLAGRAVALARQSTPDEFARLPEGALASRHDEGVLELWDEQVAALPVARGIEMALEMERAVLGYDARIRRTDGCSVVAVSGSAHLASSRGGTLSQRGTDLYLGVNPLADDAGGRQQSGQYSSHARWLARAETPEQVAREAGRRALERIGARPVPTQRVPVILHPDVAARWLAHFFGALSGDQVFKRTSYLTGALGQPIGSPLVTVVDDGLLPGGVASAPFDGDGQPTRRNVLIEKGVCRMFVYDDYWARKAGSSSTGSAVRAHTGAPAIGHRNLYLENGTTPPEEIRRGVDRGLFMTDQGAFGYNGTTGAYSYQAGGLWIENGEVVHPVQEITVASSTLDMLQGVARVGNDLRFNGAVNSPTLLIAEMTISGGRA